MWRSFTHDMVQMLVRSQWYQPLSRLAETMAGTKMTMDNIDPRDLLETLTKTTVIGDLCAWLTDQRAAHCAPCRLQNVKWIYYFSSYSASTKGLLLKIDLGSKCLVVVTPLGWRDTAEWYTAGTQGDLQCRQLRGSKWEQICREF